MKDNEPIEGEIVEDTQPIPPDGVVVASNGAWRDAETGRFVPGGQPDNAITVENTSAYHRLIAEKKFSGVVAANAGAGRLSPSGMAEDTWSDIAEGLASEAIDGKGIARVQSAQTLGRMTGLLPGSNGKDASSGPAAGRASVTVDLDQDALMEFITSRRQQETTKQDIIPGGEQQAGASGQDQADGDAEEIE